jgi:hypothetical protein
MQVLTIILNIVIFLLCLSFVVCIHEAGHLSMAKLFNVYCFEYSIGFGPALFHKRLKHKVKKGSVPVYTATTAVTPAPSANDSLAAVTVAPQAEDPQKAALLAKLNDSDSKAKAMEQASQKPVKAKKENSKYDYVEGETYLSIRALPLGGYVSMAGEDGDENPEGIKVPKERTLAGCQPYQADHHHAGRHRDELHPGHHPLLCRLCLLPSEEERLQYQCCRSQRKTGLQHR